MQAAQLAAEAAAAQERASAAQHKLEAMQGVLRSTAEQAAAAEGAASKSAEAVIALQQQLAELRDRWATPARRALQATPCAAWLQVAAGVLLLLLQAEPGRGLSVPHLCLLLGSTHQVPLLRCCRHQSDLLELQGLRAAAGGAAGLQERLQESGATAAGLAASCEGLRAALDDALARLAASSERCRQLEARDTAAQQLWSLVVSEPSLVCFSWFCCHGMPWHGMAHLHCW